jgi:hypothetical protein
MKIADFLKSNGRHRMTLCDVALGPVIVSGNTLFECNGTDFFIASPDLIITGETSEHGVEIVDSQLHVTLSDADIGSSSPFACISSSVELLLEGDNIVTSSSGGVPAIECRALSNITFYTRFDGSLTAVAGPDGAGIGAGRGSHCHSLVFVNGTFTARGNVGAGIGSSSSDSSVNSIIIVGGNISAAASSFAGAQ